MTHKRISNFKVYWKTLGFVMKRIKYVILSIFVFFVFFCIHGIIYQAFPVFMQKIDWLTGIVTFVCSFVVVNLIGSKNKTRYRLGQIAIITGAEQYDRLPEKPFREGLKQADERFGNVKVPSIVKSAIHVLVKSVVKKEMDAEQRKETLLRILKEFRSFVIITAANFVASFGSCCMAWMFWYPEEELNLKGIRNSTKHYFRNIAGIIREAIINLLIELGIIVLVAAPIAASIAMLLEGTAVCESLVRLVGDTYSLERDIALGYVYGGVIVFILFVVLQMFVYPFNRIRVVRYYLKRIRVAEENNAHFDPVDGQTVDGIVEMMDDVGIPED